MKKVLIGLVVVALTIGIVGLAEATTTLISFLYENNFAGVDNPSGWSSTDATVGLGASSWSLLSGMASVSGYINESSQELTNRGTRGMGVKGGE